MGIICYNEDLKERRLFRVAKSRGLTVKRPHSRKTYEYLEEAKTTENTRFSAYNLYSVRGKVTTTTVELFIFSRRNMQRPRQMCMKRKD